MRKLIKEILSQESLWQSDYVDSIVEAISLEEKLKNITTEFIKKYGI